MTEKAETATAGQSKNSAAPEPQVAAAAAPCGCEERISVLEGRWHAQDALNKAMSWCMLAAAAAVIYILWAGAPGGSKDAAK